MRGIESHGIGARFVPPMQGGGELFGSASRAFAPLQPGLSHYGLSALCIAGLKTEIHS
jgi:hypothetical protein